MTGLKTVSFAVLFASFAVTSHCYCDIDEVSSCLDNTVFEKYKNKISQKLFVYHDQEQITQVCSDIKIVSECWARLAPFTAACEQAVRALNQGFLDGFNYMCGEGYSEYMKSRVCLRKRTLGGKIKQCSDAYREKVTEIKHDAETGMSKYILTEKTCKDIGNAKRCIYNAVRSECTEEVANFERTFMDKLLRPLEHVAGCGGLTAVEIFLILGAACLLVSVLTVVLVCRRWWPTRRRVFRIRPESGRSGAASHTGSQIPNLEFVNPLSQQ